MSGIDKLNPQQREAALHKDGPLLILAGAGSGKTATMTQRIARLVKEEGVSPYNILAVTFTNKAAGEMRERVENLVGHVDMWIMTFHAVCLRILRANSDRLGYSSNFVVYDPTDQKAVVRRCMKDAGFESKKYNPASVLVAISHYKEKEKTPADAEAESSSAFSPVRKDMAELYKRYERMLKTNNAMDFDDLILNTVKLFENDKEVLSYYQKRFHYVMVDEYQDTNHLQYKFVKMLAEKNGNICVVGDDDQCIYQWRGADITNILNFEKDFKNAKVIRLEQNYRSKGNILKCANSVIKINPGRKEKALWTEQGDGEKVIYKIVRDEKLEAKYVAEEALSLLEEGIALKDMAVLCRTNAQSRTFEEAFIAKGIEYQMLGQVRYYDRKEIKDMLSYMSLVQNPANDIAFGRAVNEPKRGIGGKSIEQIAAKASLSGVSMMDYLTSVEDVEGLSKRTNEKLSEFVAMITSFASVYEDMKVSDLYDEILEKSGYIRALEEKDTVEDDVRIENLLEFRSAIKESEEENPEITLADFMEKIALMSDIDNHDKEADAIVVMTMHGAKGLEFPIVFMPGMEEGLFPGERSLDKPDGVEEERRLCYVGMTRAMERLYLIRTRERTIYGRRGYTTESRFINEIEKSVLDEKHDKPGSDLTGFFHGNYEARYGGSADYSSEGSNRRPFDNLRSAKRDVYASNEREIISVAIGDMVKHAKFGQGLVIEVSGNYVTVMFDETGRKKLALDVAPLEKL